MENRKELLATAPVPKLLIKYGVPATLGMFVDAIYNLVDAIFIGQGGGTLALSALTVSFPLYLIVLGITLCFGLGTASIISRALGANEDEKAYKAAGNTFSLVALTSVVIMILGLLFMEELLLIFGSTPEIMPYAKDYMTYIFLATLPFSFTVAGNHIVRSEGNAKTSMISGFIFAGLNTILDPVFIFGFDMGIKGASVATLISCTCSSIYLLYYFLGKKSHLLITRKHLHLDLKMTLETLKVGSPIMIRLYLASFIGFLVNNSIKHYGNESYFAVVSILYRLMIFMSLPIYGISNGLQPIIGFNYGAKNYDRVMKALTLGNIVSTLFSSVFFLLMLLFPEFLLSMFTPDQSIVRIGSPLLILVLMIFPLYGIQMVGAGFFQAIGKSRAALVHMISNQFIFVPLVIVLPMFFGLNGVWITYPTAAYLAFVLVAIGQYREIARWKTMKSVK